MSASRFLRISGWLLVVACAPLVSAATLTVGASDSIQDAIDAANAGDTIAIAPGRYVETLVFVPFKNVVLTSTDPNDPAVVKTTILDGGGAGPVITMTGTETAATLLTGLTITNGSAATGAGIYGSHTHATIRQCVIVDNHATGSGGGIAAWHGAIAACTVRDNTAGGQGGGLSNCDGLVTNTLITRNRAQGVGGGLSDCDGPINHATVISNVSATSGGGLSGCGGTITNCVLWGNTAPSSAQLGSSAIPTASCIQAWAGGGAGNTSADPDFVLAGDAYVTAGSPCVDSGVSSGVGSDRDGNARPIGAGVDMGAYEHNPGRATIAIAPAELVLHGTEGHAVSETGTIRIGNAGGGTLTWTLATEAPWLTLGMTAGLTTIDVTTIDASADLGGLAAGVYTATVTISATDAPNSPRDISVRLIVNKVIMVDGGAGDTIQAAIDLANPRDTVVVQPGIYYENLVFDGNDVTVISSDANDPAVVAATVIDGGWDGPVVTFDGAETEATVLAGLTLRNGMAADGGSGGGVRGNGTHAAIRQCRIIGNIAMGEGGGLSRCDGLIEGCTISANRAETNGGGLSRCNGVITDCVIAGNAAFLSGGGLYACGGRVTRCAIRENVATSGGGMAASDAAVHACGIRANRAVTGGGLHSCDGRLSSCLIADNLAYGNGGGLYDCDGTIVNATLVGNVAELQGGGLHSCGGLIRNGIIWANAAPSAPQLYSCATPSYCCIQDWGTSGTGNISTNPLLVTDGDYHVSVGSPCVDTGDDASAGLNDTTTAAGTECIIIVVDASAYAVGGLIEIAADDVLRHVTAIDTQRGAVTFDPPLAGATSLGMAIKNYGLGDADGVDRIVGVKVDRGCYERDALLPVIGLDTDGLVFYAVQDGGDPAGGDVQLSNVGGVGLVFSLSDDAAWLTVTGDTADLPAGQARWLTASVSVSGLSAGTYEAQAMIVAPAAPSGGRAVRVSLHVSHPEPLWVDDDAANDPGPGDPNSSDPVEDGSADHPFDTIGEAIRAAVPGDTITLGQGTYVESVDFSGKAVVVTGEDPDGSSVVAATVIQGDGGPAVTFNGTEEAEHTAIVGVTLTGGVGTATRPGGGVSGHSTRAAVRDCVIRDNSSPTHGGGMHLVNGEIRGCVVSDNTATNDGGGFYRCDGAITNCLIVANSAGYDGGGMFDCDGAITHCTVGDNHASHYGGGLKGCGGAVTNCVVAGNTSLSTNPATGPEVYDLPNASYCCILGWTGGLVGNISDDPMFAAIGDYHLDPNSPCVDTATDAGVTIDLDGTARPQQSGPDRGVYEYDPTRATIAVSPRQVSIHGISGQAASESGVFEIVSAGGVALNWTVTVDVAWLKFDPDPTTGSLAPGASQTITLWADSPAQIGRGEHTAVVTVSDPTATNSPQTVRVVLTIGGLINVCADGSGDYATIQEAINHALADDAVVLCPGTYTEHIAFGGKRIIVASSDPTDPDVVAATVIDGGGSVGPVVTFSGSETSATRLMGVTIQNGSASRGGGIDGNGTGAAIIGCVITQCASTGANADTDGGGGLYECHGPITDCAITDNTAAGSGGGLFACNGSVSGCMIGGNQATNYGGGMAGCNGPISGSILSGNSASRYGGALYKCHGAVTDCTLTDNTASLYGGAARECNGPFTNCTITGNTAGHAGAFDLCGGAITGCIITRCAATGNGGNGGALRDCDGPIHGCVIAENTAKGDGGGLYLCDGTLNACTIRDNRAMANGGAMAQCGAGVTNSLLVGNIATTYGGAMYACSGPVTHCTIAANSASAGGGLSGCYVPITNCIVWGNTAADAPQLRFSSEPTYSCIAGWTGGGIGNDPNDPMFVLVGDYHVDPNSPCVDTGSATAVTDDADGNVRPLGAAVDRGAYEYNATAPTIAVAPATLALSGLTIDTEPTTAQLRMTNAGGGAMSLYITDDADADGVDWLTVVRDNPVEPNTGQIETAIIQANASSLPEGVYRATITVAAPGAVNPPRAISVVFTVTEPGQTLTVDPDGTGVNVYTTIQAAIDAAGLYDRIEVTPGTYVETINIKGKTIELLALAGGTTTIRSVDGDGGHGSAAVVIFDGSETADTRISGFTITNGYSSYGAGIFGDGTHATIENCVITGNIATYDGAGLYQCHGLITNCQITDNQATRNGGGLYDCDGTIRDCTIAANIAVVGGGGLYDCDGVIEAGTVRDNAATGNGGGLWGSNATIRNCVITRNAAGAAGGGLYDCRGKIRNCLITDNTAVTQAGGLYNCDGGITNCTIVGNSAIGLVYSARNPTLTNTIVYANTPKQIALTSANLTASYCDIQGGQNAIANTTSVIQWGDGNLDTAPAFVQTGDYQLQAGSPCVDAGDTTAAVIFTDMTTADGDPNGIVVADASRYALGDELEYLPEPGLRTVSAVNVATSTVRFDEPLATPSTTGQTVRTYGSGDLAGSDRVIASAVDIGAYEYNGDEPVIAIGPASLTLFGADSDDTSHLTQLTITNAGGGTLNWSIAADASWLHVSEPSGSLAASQVATLDVWADLTGLAIGPYTASLTATDVNAVNSPRVVPVQLTVRAVINVPTDHATIQAAIDAAQDGDTIVVRRGTYRECIDFGGKQIVVRSAEPYDLSKVAFTTIDAQASGSAVTFAGTETDAAMLAGFTIINGSAGISGGGIAGNTTTATISHCVVRDNEAFNSGGGIAMCDGLITNCIVADNMAQFGGGLTECNGTIANSVITSNYADQTGGGLDLCGGTVRNCTIVHNQAGVLGGAFFGWGPDFDATMSSSIVWANDTPQIALISAISPSSLTLQYGVLDGGPDAVFLETGCTLNYQGLANTQADPMFADADGADDNPVTWRDNNYHVGPDSPCTNAGDPTYMPALDETDLDAQPRLACGRVDIGAYESQTCEPGGLDDLAVLIAAMNGPGQPPNDAAGDLDYDGDCDLADYAVFAGAFIGP